MTMPGRLIEVDAAEAELLMSAIEVAEDVIRRHMHAETVVAFRGLRGYFVRRAEMPGVDLADVMSDLEGAVLVHNHPSGSSFTTADAIVAFNARLAELRVAAPHAIYVLQPGTLSWALENVDEIVSRFKEHYRSVYRENERSGFGRFSGEHELNRYLRDATWRRIAEHGIVLYNRLEVVR
jgi:hypothetical protein